MNVLDLFSGIGSFSLGLERAGMHTVGFCEIDPYCRAVLRKHWPATPIWDDVRTLKADEFPGDCPGIDVICGGFPCQDISIGGKGAGIEGERSGLWREFARLIGEIRPRYAIVENVAALLGRGMGDVLGDLAAIGYDAEWHCIPAAAVGAPHFRDRVWIVAYPLHGGHGFEIQSLGELWGSPTADVGSNGEVQPMADADRGNGHRRSGDVQMGWGRYAREATQACIEGRIEWPAEPDVGRVAYGVAGRLQRLTALGNGLVPQIPEIIGRAIMSTCSTAQRPGVK